MTKRKRRLRPKIIEGIGQVSTSIDRAPYPDPMGAVARMIPDEIACEQCGGEMADRGDGPECPPLPR